MSTNYGANYGTSFNNSDYFGSSLPGSPLAQPVYPTSGMDELADRFEVFDKHKKRKKHKKHHKKDKPPKNCRKCMKGKPHKKMSYCKHCPMYRPRTRFDDIIKFISRCLNGLYNWGIIIFNLMTQKSSTRSLPRPEDYIDLMGDDYEEHDCW